MKINQNNKLLDNPYSIKYDTVSKRQIQFLDNGIACRIEPGTGDKVLWLHGYTLDSSSWGRMWSLLPGWCHIGIDLPGHGASAPVTEGGSLKEVGSLIGRICIEHNIRHIVALSFGTITALQAALGLPDYFSSVVLGAPAIAGGPQDPEMAKAYSMLMRFYKQGCPSEHLHAAWMESRAWKGIEKDPALLEALSSIVARHSWEELGSFAKMKNFTSPPQNIDDLNGIQSAVLILVGEYEMSAFRRCADIIKERIPHCEQKVLPGTGHLCMLQSPELSAELIHGHLSKCAACFPVLHGH